MGIFSSILQRSTPSASGSVTVQSQPSVADRFFFGEGQQGTHAGVAMSRDTALKISTVYGAVSLISKVIAQMDILMQQRDGRGNWVAAPQHPIADLLTYQPNSYMTAFEFKSQMTFNLVMRGTSYAAINPGPRGSVDSLIPLNPDCVQPVWLPGRELAFDVHDSDAGIYGRLLADEMFRIRAPLSRNGITGLSPMACAMQTFGVALAAEEHGARMFNQGARPTGTIEVPNEMSDRAYERFKEQLKEDFDGIRNVHKTMILEDGAKFNPIQLKADEMQFLQLRSFTVEEICRWFDVPSVLLHHTDKSTSFGTGIEQVMLAFLRNNLMSWIVSWQQAMRRDLITSPRQYQSIFDVNALIRGDSTAVSKWIQLLVLTGVITRNEARAVIGYNPLEGLDVPLIPVTAAQPNDKPVDGQSEEPDPENPDGGPQDDTTDSPSSPKPGNSGNARGGLLLPRPRKR